ncbi:MAG: glycosyltransferase family 4 protein [Candidatus Lokiarchaeota archaeon]|nr:glycosyltransferase family 4 protein [Candidatus Lokiarchaeota archaeon]
MKIAFFCNEFVPLRRSLGVYTREMSRKFLAAEHEVTVFTTNPDGSLLSSEMWKGIEVHRPEIVDIRDMIPVFVSSDLMQSNYDLHAFADMVSYNILASGQLINEIVGKEKREFDIISAHNSDAILAGIAAKRQLNIPLIFHVHSTERIRGMGRGSLTIENIERRGLEVADAIIVPSYAVQEELLRMGLKEEERKKIFVCWDGVNAEIYSPSNGDDATILELRERYGINDDDPMIFYIGDFGPSENIDTLIKAIPDVISEFPRSKFVLLSEDVLSIELKELAERPELRDNIIIRTEYVSEQEKIAHYITADVAVFPSTWKPFGRSCTEVMACSTPVVVGAQGGIIGLKEQIVSSGEGHCGYHVNPYDPKDIAWGIKNILRDPDHAKILGENARKRVLAEFTWDKCAERTLPIYETDLKN